MKKKPQVCLSVGLLFIVSIFLPLPVHAEVTVAPASLNFGAVTLNASKTVTAIANQSGRSDAILQVSSDIREFVVFAPDMPVNLPPFGSISFPVIFAPSSVGSFHGRIIFSPVSAGDVSGSLTLVSNAPSSPLVVSLAGSGIPCVLQFTANPGLLNFGSLTTGSSATQSVTLTNTGNFSVTFRRSARAARDSLSAALHCRSHLLPGSPARLPQRLRQRGQDSFLAR